MCPNCRKPHDPAMDARRASATHKIALRHFHHCPACFHLLTLDESERLGRRRRAARSTVPD